MRAFNRGFSRRNALAATGAAIALATFSSPSIGAKEIATDREFWLSKWMHFVDADTALGNAGRDSEKAAFDAEQEYPTKKLTLLYIVGTCRKDDPGKIVPAWTACPLCHNGIVLQAGKKYGKKRHRKIL